MACEPGGKRTQENRFKPARELDDFETQKLLKKEKRLRSPRLLQPPRPPGPSTFAEASAALEPQVPGRHLNLWHKMQLPAIMHQVKQVMIVSLGFFQKPRHRSAMLFYAAS